MNNRLDDYPDEPPPSYEEATGGTSPRPSLIPPALPPRNPPPLPIRSSSTASNHERASSQNSNNPFFNSKPNGSNNLTIPPSHQRHSSASASTSPISPGASHHHHPAQTFSQLLPTSQLHPRQFPPSINLYRDAFPGALQRRYFLGEHQATPLYAVAAWLSSSHPSPSLLLSSSLSSSLVLHNGPSEDYPPLATASYDNVWGGRRTMQVVVPPLPGQERSDPIVVQTGTSIFMGGLGGSGALAFSFSVEIPWPSSTAPNSSEVTWRKEPYEWRRSNSYAVGGLGGSSQGWKLVRLSNELPPGGLTMSGSGPPSGDGHEVVAVCTNAVMSMTKLWKFSFLGTGLSGALGERWAVMAVMTGLVIWDRDSRRDGLR